MKRRLLDVAASGFIVLTNWFLVSLQRQKSGKWCKHPMELCTEIRYDWVPLRVTYCDQCGKSWWR